MTESLPYDEIKFGKNVNLEDILNNDDDGDIGYFIGTDLKYPNELKERTICFPICTENKNNPQDIFSNYMYEMQPTNNTQSEKLTCDWTNKKNYLTCFKIFKIYVRYAIILDKNHQI